jgi:hypothetical protein
MRRYNPNILRRFVLTLFAFLCLTAMPAVVPAQQPAPQRPADTKTETVYVTKTGKRYHRKNCRHLTSSQRAMSLKDAKAAGYTPCKVCRPAE